MYFDCFFAVVSIVQISSMHGAINKKSRPARLAGGEVAHSFEFPFMTVIHHKTMICSGAIIAEEWVLTAAHCFALSHIFNLRPNDVKVIAGLINYSRRTEYTQIRHGIAVFVHPNYGVSELSRQA